MDGSIGARRRWVGRLAALVAGALPVLAFPEPSWSWWAFLALVPLLTLLRAAPTPGEAARWGWCGGVGFLLAAHHWLAPVVGPFLPLVAAALALPWLAWGWLVHRWLRPTGGLAGLAVALAVVPAGWVVLELVRSWEHLGGPWALLGASQWNGPALPLAALGGVWLVSAVVVAVNVAATVAVWPRTAPPVRAAAGGAALLGLCAGPVAGTLLAPPPARGTAAVAVVQPGPTPGPDARFDAGEAATLALAGSRPDVVLWGESSVGADLQERPDLLARLRSAAGAVGADILVNVDARRPGGAGIFKSAVVVGPDGVRSRADKVRLVPFGEHIPLRPLLGWTAAVADAADENRRRGQGLAVQRSGRLDLGTLVCFESAFPDLSRHLAREGADLLVYQSATTTFQASWAPEQHASLAALRAVESGRPVVHVTLTGVSAAFDAQGRRLLWHGTDRRGAVVVEVPLAAAATPYVRLGDWVPALALAVTAAGLTRRGSSAARAESGCRRWGRRAPPAATVPAPGGRRARAG